MKIKVINVEVTEQKKGQRSWKAAEVTFKDLEKNKVASRKLVSFNFPEVFETLSNAAKDSEYDVQLQKNEDTGYWDWIGIGSVDESDADSNNGASASAKPGRAKAGGGSSSYGRDFETRAERDRRQASITKAVAVERAIQYLEAQGAGIASLDQVFTVATKIAEYLAVPLPDDTPLGFEDAVEGVAMMADDVPA